MLRKVKQKKQIRLRKVSLKGRPCWGGSFCICEPEESNSAPQKSNADSPRGWLLRSKSAFCAAEKSNSPKHSFAFAKQKCFSGGEADFLTKLKSSDCEPEESNPGGEADFLTKLKSSD